MSGRLLICGALLGCGCNAKRFSEAKRHLLVLQLLPNGRVSLWGQPFLVDDTALPAKDLGTLSGALDGLTITDKQAFHLLIEEAGSGQHRANFPPFGLANFAKRGRRAR
jgi:hypothetical protein